MIINIKCKIISIQSQEMQVLHLLRHLILCLVSTIFTVYITFLHVMLSALLLIPIPSSFPFSHIWQDLRYNNLCSLPKGNRVKLTNTLFLLLNVTLSLISVLVIVNYCTKMLAVVEWVSHQTHLWFLSFVLPQIPEIGQWTPEWVAGIYLAFSYLGITVQLGFTLDLIYLYNLPTIIIYKLLALLYSRLIVWIKFCFQVLQYSHPRWLTCPYQFLSKSEKVNKVIAIFTIVVLAQIIVIVIFYYLWLTIVIILLIVIINFIKNIIQIIRSLSSILLFLKGFTIDQLETQQFEVKKESPNFSLLQKYKNLKQQIVINWVPLIKLQDIKDIFIGKDIFKTTPHQFTHHQARFSIRKVYQSFMRMGEVHSHSHVGAKAQE